MMWATLPPNRFLILKNGIEEQIEQRKNKKGGPQEIILSAVRRSVFLFLAFEKVIQGLIHSFLNCRMLEERELEVRHASYISY